MRCHRTTAPSAWSARTPVFDGARRPDQGHGDTTLTLCAHAYGSATRLLRCEARSLGTTSPRQLGPSAQFQALAPSCADESTPRGTRERKRRCPGVHRVRSWTALSFVGTHCAATRVFVAADSRTAVLHGRGISSARCTTRKFRSVKPINVAISSCSNGQRKAVKHMLHNRVVEHGSHIILPRLREIDQMT
jgi:hypothetical protein